MQSHFRFTLGGQLILLYIIPTADYSVLIKLLASEVDIFLFFYIKKDLEILIYFFYLESAYIIYLNT